jgi:group I intron endonuclease
MRKNNTAGIYRIRNIINNHIYIGSAVSMELRKKDHFGRLRRNIHGNDHLQNAFNKYGYYLDTLLFAQEYIKNGDRRFLELGYNICPTAGNTLGMKHSEETKKLYSIQRMGSKNVNFGKKVSEERKIKCQKTRKDNYSETVESYRKMHSKRMKPVIQYDLSGIIIAEFGSINEVTRKTGYNESYISSCCNKRPKYDKAYGFIWRFKNI